MAIGNPLGLSSTVTTGIISALHPARRCDIDHLRPWARGGTTSLDNLTVLCQAHHRLKHTPGWSLVRLDDGALLWRTPSGARYRREADGTILRLPRRVGPRSLVDAGGPVPADLAAAVTGPVLERLERGLASIVKFLAYPLPLFSAHTPNLKGVPE